MSLGAGCGGDRSDLEVVVDSGAGTRQPDARERRDADALHMAIDARAQAGTRIANQVQVAGETCTTATSSATTQTPLRSMTRPPSCRAVRTSLWSKPLKSRSRIMSKGLARRCVARAGSNQGTVDVLDLATSSTSSIPTSSRSNSTVTGARSHGRITGSIELLDVGRDVTLSFTAVLGAALTDPRGEPGEHPACREQPTDLPRPGASGRGGHHQPDAHRPRGRHPAQNGRRPCRRRRAAG